jgi:hypothetical protein
MPTIVNVDNFARAETDRMFDSVIALAGGFGEWLHFRVPTPFDEQPVIRQNRDTLYSAVVIDVREGARLSLPDMGGRYFSALVIDEDHYVAHVITDPGEHELAADSFATPYATVAIRILVDPNDQADVAEVNALQDRLRIDPGSAEPFTHPEYDPVSFDETREHLLALSRRLPDLRGAFGARGEVDEVRHLLVTASAWGGFPEHEAMYLTVEPGLPVGRYELAVRDVPVDGFWSVTVYNADGYLEPNEKGVVSVNNITAVPDDDGAVTIRFGDGDAPNTLPITEGWNYVVRLYRPRPEALSREWEFPSITKP